MNLPVKNREVLAVRAKLCVVYAALWGFGGTANSTERRKYFDNTLRDAIQQFFIDENDSNKASSGDLPITTDCCLFECVLNLQECVIAPAVELDPRSLSKLSNPGIPKKFESLNVYAALLANAAAAANERQNANNMTVLGAQDRLVFRTQSGRAVDAAVRRLLGTGANLVLFGAKGCGKSMLVADVLADLKTHLPTPQGMRQQVNDHLVDIVNGAKKSEGIFAALEILKYIMGKFATTELKDDTQTEFSSLWNAAGEGLKVSNVWVCG